MNKVLENYKRDDLNKKRTVTVILIYHWSWLQSATLPFAIWERNYWNTGTRAHSTKRARTQRNIQRHTNYSIWTKHFLLFFPSLFIIWNSDSCGLLQIKNRPYMWYLLRCIIYTMFFFVVLTKVDDIQMTSMQPINSGRNRQKTNKQKHANKTKWKNGGEYNY